MITVNIDEALRRASYCLRESGIDRARDEAEILLAHCLNTDRLQLFLMRDAEILPEIDSCYREFISRRCHGEPLAYITSEKYFYGRKYLLNRNVLIPRPETELLIDAVLQWNDHVSKRNETALTCIDLGTGSGVLAITIALHLPKASVWAVDVSGLALKIAKENAALHNITGRISWYNGSYFDALSDVKVQPCFDLVITNPPYLTHSELDSLPGEIKNYEPLIAFDGGEDGLSSFRMIFESLKDYTKTQSVFFAEIGDGQKDKIEQLCAATKTFQSLKWHYDLAGKPRVIQGLI